MNSINLSSRNWAYETGDDVLAKIFVACQIERVDLVCLNIHWHLIEKTKGVYDDAYLDRIVHICNFAADYGLQCIIDFHTLYQASYPHPSWLVDVNGASCGIFRAIAGNPGMRYYWLRMVAHVVEYIESRANIHSWHLMNEPTIEAGYTTAEQFLQLFEQTREFAHALKPVSIRFGCYGFTRSTAGKPAWNTLSAVFTVCDYMSLNFYYEYHTEEQFRQAVASCRQYGKQIMITEFGSKLSDETDQANAIKQHVDLFAGEGISDSLVWHVGDYEGGLGFNLWNGSGLRLGFSMLNPLPVPTCPSGQHWDEASQSCVDDVPTCPSGQHWDETTETCVNDKTRSFAARSIGPFGVPSGCLQMLWRLRQKLLSEEAHRKLHPLV